MPVTRTDLEARERATLAPYAQFSGDTRGRVHAEAPPEWRTQFQRDRDRVIHSRAFRRLEYKTQVFLNGTGDHLRTRLTHTMEVAAISRNIARALRLNEDLAETIALAHDLGHSPFGHTGEAALDRLMRGHGGFEHNRQSLRVVELLEQKYPGFRGLNLSWEVREGLAKHQTGFDVPPGGAEFQHRQPSLEAQIANLADEVTYYSHDLDDGLDSGLLSERQLTRDVEAWRHATRLVRREHGALPDECRRYFIIRTIIDEQVKDVVLTTEARLRAAKVRSADEVRAQARPLVTYSAERRRLNVALRKYLYRNLYYNPEVKGPNERAGLMLKELFAHYLAHPRELGEATRARIRTDGAHRAVCDYLAGMTDRFAMAAYARFFPGATAC
ncbi:MAG: deoxyguanosinetriphosphate triphosphohydrolase [Limisphaerales bacterium]